MNDGHGQHKGGVPLNESLRILAHDVRSPLHTIVMAADLLELGAGADPRVLRLIGIIRAAARQMDGIVEDVLVSAERGVGTSRTRPAVDAGMALVEAAEQHAGMAELKGVTLDVDPPEEPAYAAIGREPLMRALANLISNAIRHTPADGRVRLAALQPGPDVAFLVADTGTGMDPIALERLLQSSAEGAPPGRSGNGLAIVQGIVRAAGGHLSAVSRPGAGSTFTLCVPAAHRNASALRQATDQALQDATTAGWRR
jgi:two-component system, OmpR family, sensor kinase